MSPDLVEAVPTIAINLMPLLTVLVLVLLGFAIFREINR